MSRISLQFHGTFDEILEFVIDSAKDLGVHVILMWRSPIFRASFADSEGDAASAIAAFGKPSYIRLTTQPPILAVTSEADFSRKNPTAMLIDIGDQTESGMNESFLGAKTDDPIAAALWRRVADRWRKRTVAGATAVNPSTGARGFIKTHRFTEGARNLARAGVTMWALGGKSFYEVSRDT